MKYKIISLLILCSLSLIGCTTEELNKNSTNKNSELALEVNLQDVENIEEAPRLKGNSRIFSLEEIALAYAETIEIQNIRSNEVAKWGEIAGKEVFVTKSGIFAIESEVSNIVRTIALDIELGTNIKTPSKSFIKDSLAFDSKENAIKKCEEILEKLKIEYDGSPEVYALDYKTLQEKQDEITNEPAYKEDIDSGRLIVKDAWTEEDEGYYIIFNLELENLKLDPVGYESKDTLYSTNGSNIIFWVNKTGVDAVYAECDMYETTNISEEKYTLLSKDEVLEKVQNKYKDVLLGDGNSIEDIQLLYVPIIKSVENDGVGGIFVSEYEIEPCWVIKVASKIELEEGVFDTIYQFERISAITGEFVE